MLSLLRWERGQRNYAFWLEVMERLMAGRLCATQVEQWSCIEKREERRRTEITYCETFPMRYGQEHLLDSKTHTRLTDGWKEIFSRWYRHGPGNAGHKVFRLRRGMLWPVEQRDDGVCPEGTARV